MVWCRADSVTADLIHLSYPTVRTVAHRRAAAGPGGERRGLYRFPQRPEKRRRTTPGAPPESELNCFEFPVIIYVLNGPARHTQRVT